VLHTGIEVILIVVKLLSLPKNCRVVDTKYRRCSTLIVAHSVTYNVIETFKNVKFMLYFEVCHPRCVYMK